jgi:hypothetical protein
VATNPRIEDLRKRIEKDPGSRLFAQLAEELRKDGELEDAIRVAREGLQKHPSYPSARMTLGRALLDTGDWTAARTEFELVLKTAADNILASRYLGECLENLGERDAAIARYKATLAMAPGEKHVVARLQELEKGKPSAPASVAPAAAKPAAPSRSAAAPSASPAAPSTMGLRAASAPPAPAVARPAPPPPAPPLPPTASAAPSSPPPAPSAPLPPIPLSTVDGEMELETSGTPPETPAPGPATASVPIPLVAADEEFELEKAYESPTTGIRTVAATTPSEPSRAAAAPAPAPRTDTEVETEEEEFELEASRESPASGWAASIRPLPPEEPARTAPPAAPTAPAPNFAAGPEAAPAGTASSLLSPTLGELYFNQGFTEKAIEVYRELSAREPGNERLSARLRELEKLERTLGGGLAAEPERTAAPERTGEPAADSAAADRREQIERTIARLEGLLSAIRKG